MPNAQLKQRVGKEHVAVTGGSGDAASILHTQLSAESHSKDSPTRPTETPAYFLHLHDY